MILTVPWTSNGAPFGRVLEEKPKEHEGTLYNSMNMATGPEKSLRSMFPFNFLFSGLTSCEIQMFADVYSLSGNITRPLWNTGNVTMLDVDG